MKHGRRGVWLVVVVALSLVLAACTTPPIQVPGAARAKEWTYANTGIPAWWWYTLLDLKTVHMRAKGTGKSIAIVDTGVLPGQQDIATILPGVATCGSDANDIADRNGHGTQLAGIALGKDPGPDFLSIDPLPVITRGVAPAASLVPIRIDCGLVTTDALVNGVKAAIGKKPDIILIALGGYPPDVDASLSALVSKSGKDILFVVASVWDGYNYPFPGWTRPDPAKGKVDNVLIVAAMTLIGQDEVPYNDRQVGDIWAPGRDIETAGLDTIPKPDPKAPSVQAQFLMQGTSAASAIVAGCAALVKQKAGYAGAGLKAILVKTTTTKPGLGSIGRLDCSTPVPP